MMGHFILERKFISIIFIMVLIASSLIFEVHSDENKDKPVGVAKEGTGAKNKDKDEPKPDNKSENENDTGKNPKTDEEKKEEELIFCYNSPDCNQKAVNSSWRQGDCKSGAMQSPININTRLLIGETPIPIKVRTGELKGHNIKLTEDVLENYNFNSFQLTNIGYTIMIDSFVPNSGEPASFTWPDLIDGMYKLDRAYFHWGPNSSLGSEHYIDRKPYSGELQLVHYRSEGGPEEDSAYGDYDSAVKSEQSDAIAIISIFLQADKTYKEEPLLDPVWTNLGGVGSKGAKTTVSSELKLRELLSNQYRAYSYMGSLTVPPCSEIVAWLLCTDPFKIKEDDIAQLRSAVTEEPKGNHRNPQRPKTWQGTLRPVKLIKLK